ncbi:MAG: hypothetical protein CMR00_03545 [[Chlorobium] sp. 445]|nr:MAG: hypothetical protein CMR00_03545 [[Chlorobium] sp. 445]
MYNVVNLANLTLNLTNMREAMQVIETQPTPNPNALKFIIAGTFPPGSHAFMSHKEAENDALAKAIFELGEVTSVFYMNNFLTVSKTLAGDWNKLREGVIAILSQM